LLNLQGKTSLYDFYYAVEHKQDNVGLKRNKGLRPKVSILKFSQVLPTDALFRTVTSNFFLQHVFGGISKCSSVQGGGMIQQELLRLRWDNVLSSVQRALILGAIFQ
jgi:hypothetical protein